MKGQADDSQYFPIAIDVEEDKTYIWCGCGQSKTQPFCDRTDCGEKSLEYTAELNETLYFCACKKTKTPPLCDGSHAKLLMARVKNKKK